MGCYKRFTWILRPFAELTEKLEGTKYAMMSYIYSSITKLKKLFCSTKEFYNSNVDLETNNNAFEEHQLKKLMKIINLKLDEKFK